LGVNALLPPTSSELLDGATRPYFLWWSDATVDALKRHLKSDDATERAYWMGALLREANTRDVWLFVAPQEIRENWTQLLRYLGKSREMWGYLLGLDAAWPPSEARSG
jgi:hypothetical protein